MRSANLALHDRGNPLDKVRPATLCHLALDASLGGDRESFKRSIALLCAATRPGDENQWRFNATVIVRGLVALGDHDSALRWSRDETRIEGCRAPATLTLASSCAATTLTAPEISAVRSLVRALRRLGRPGEAIALGTWAVKTAAAPAELFGWMLALVQLELGLAHGDAGDDEAANLATRDAQARLVREHPTATRCHAALLSPDATERERELDRVWY